MCRAFSGSVHVYLCVYVSTLKQQESGWNSGEVALLSRKPAVSLKRGKIGPRLLVMTNRKSHMRLIPLTPKHVTLNDLDWPFCVKFCFASVCLEL